ncbi:MAG: hypothetical protein DPW09_29685 [Anaerolineae bacterium]|nr:hypothetical protein [Anaerolineales bacterium]MCQ3977619.1 hypothetical protein [Anaerolineae bacterium]
MNDTQLFFFGFGLTTLVGWLSGLLVASWNTVDKTHKRMFINVPKPALKPIPDSRNKSVGTDPDQSPLQVLLQGCITILGQLMIQIIFLFALGVILIVGLQQEITQKSFVGIIFAGIVGFLTQNIRKNWKKIIQLYKMITTPPNPSLKLEPASPPNSHYVAATLGPPPPPPPLYPPLPPFTVLVKGFYEISWRLIWQLILLFLLFQSFIAAYFYLRDGTIRFLGGEAFVT